MSTSRALWDRYREFLSVSPSLGLTVDISRMRFGDDFFSSMEPRMQKAFAAMDALEAGAIANPDEQRRVGHYWLRDASRAPAELRSPIRDVVAAIEGFAHDVHAGKIAGHGGAFTDLLIIGIGGSALGPELVADALGTHHDRLRPHFFDNTDPDGMDRVLGALHGRLGTTLTVVISKSGGTKETRNGMLEAALAYKKAGLDFAQHAVAVTGDGSELDKVAVGEKWLRRFPMWDWIGGRTSELSVVGLLPAALQGIAIEALLTGARDCDELTRVHDTKRNPAALLALMWYFATDGKGHKDMVILPYKDRLLLFSRYLQQLVMESLGKEKDLDGNVVHQGIAVYGNKGSTDQHAYVQQLREGVPNFFVTFIEVLHDRHGASAAMEDGATSGDYLMGFLQGTRRALYENGRDSITITIDKLDARSLGALIALYERAVGFYGSLVNVNAYHQPGVEAGKKAAGAVLALQKRVLGWLAEQRGHTFTADQIAEGIGAADDVETVFKILMHAGFNADHGLVRQSGATLFEMKFGKGA